MRSLPAWPLLLLLASPLGTAGCGDDAPGPVTAVCDRAVTCGLLDRRDRATCVAEQVQFRNELRRRNMNAECTEAIDALVLCVGLQSCGAPECDGCAPEVAAMQALRDAGTCAVVPETDTCDPMGADMGVGDMSLPIDMDVAPNPDCPAGDEIPNPEGLLGACCFRASNIARRDAVVVRLNSFAFEAPGPLAVPAAGGAPLVPGLVQSFVDAERLNVLVSVDGGDERVSVSLGGGSRDDPAASDLFRFDDAPTDARSDNPLLRDAGRWGPIRLAASYAGDQLTTERATEVVSFPIAGSAGSGLPFELPLRGVRLTLDLDASRTCAGTRDPAVEIVGFAPGGTLEGYIQVEDTLGIVLQNPPLRAPLCRLLATTLTLSEECDPRDRGDWRTPPDSVCAGGRCSLGGCDPLRDCNAWRVSAQVSAAGVDLDAGAP